MNFGALVFFNNCHIDKLIILCNSGGVIIVRLPGKTPGKNVIILKKTMKTLKYLSIISILLIFCGILLVTPVLTDTVKAQDYIYTSTPEGNGNIYYIVKSGDTCQSIALINGVPLDDLRSLNQLNLGDCDALTIGRKLLIGIVPTAVITAGPSPTPTPLLPTPIPPKGVGDICVYLFNDINGNAIAETGETSLAGGEISIASASGDYTNTGSSTGDDLPVCFSQISEGQYTISVAIPEGYNATTDQNYTADLKAGDTATINFGAQESSRFTGSGGSTGSIWLAILGGLILVAGVGIGFYAYITTKKR